jgi:hypothetical protein
MIPGVGAATLTRPFGAIAPIKGGVKRRLSSGGRGRTRSVRMVGETPRSSREIHSSDIGRQQHANGRAS